MGVNNAAALSRVPANCPPTTTAHFGGHIRRFECYTTLYTSKQHTTTQHSNTSHFTRHDSTRKNITQHITRTTILHEWHARRITHYTRQYNTLHALHTAGSLQCTQLHHNTCHIHKHVIFVSKRLTFNTLHTFSIINVQIVVFANILLCPLRLHTHMHTHTSPSVLPHHRPHWLTLRCDKC